MLLLQYSPRKNNQNKITNKKNQPGKGNRTYYVTMQCYCNVRRVPTRLVISFFSQKPDQIIHVTSAVWICRNVHHSGRWDTSKIPLPFWCKFNEVEINALHFNASFWQYQSSFKAKLDRRSYDFRIPWSSNDILRYQTDFEKTFLF